MTDRPAHDLSPPKPLLYAIFAMVLLTMGLVGVTQLLGLNEDGAGGPPPVEVANVLLIEATPVQDLAGEPAAPAPASDAGGAAPASDAPGTAERMAAEARAHTQEGAGKVTVRRLEDGEIITVLEGSESGFVRGLMRSLGRQRDVDGVPKDAPYRISRWPDGSLTFDDPATGERIPVRAFGPENRQQVADLLRMANERPAGAGESPQEAAE